MSLLTIALATIIAPKYPEAARCPSVASQSAPSASATSSAGRELLCSGLEVSGRIQGDGLVLDPAFTSSAPLADFSRAAPGGHAMLQGYAADGRTIFTFPLDGTGSFRVLVPLDPKSLAELHRLRLSSANVAVERVSDVVGSPDAEVIDVDGSHLIIAWDSTTFPAVRVRDAHTGRALAYGAGNSTYTQLSLQSGAPVVVIDFSDGVHSVPRAFRVFGRN